jgi:transcriptional antiterminator NusG
MVNEEEKEEAVFETAPEEETKEEPKAEEVKEEVKPAEAAPAEAKPAEEAKSAEEGDSDSSEMQWYVVNTYSGREMIVKDYIEKRRESMGQTDNINRVLVPTEEEVIIDKKTNKPAMKKNGEIKKKTIILYPGYIFVEAIMTDITWYIIRNTPGVTGLVGSSGSGTKPYPIPHDDMVPILKKAGLVVNKVRGDYVIGEKVRIVDGAFADEEGEIATVDVENAQAGVTVLFFGRPSTVTVAFSSLEKAE